MNLAAPLCFVTGLACALLVAAPQQDGGPSMADMMAQAKRYTQPNQNHAALERMVGKWNTETRLHMGAQTMPGEKGTSEFRWRLPGRWLEGSWDSPMMGMPAKGVTWLGYDNFKQSYVYTQITNMDTAMNHAEGDMTPDGKSLILYGTLDEYLTGENDKMVKYAWRFVSDDEMRLEVHDLPIGEENTLVVEAVYTRVK